MSTASPAGTPTWDSTRAAQLYAVAALVLGVGAGIDEREPATALAILAAAVAMAAFALSARGVGTTGSRFLVHILSIGIGGNLLIGLIAPPLLEDWYRPFLAVMGTAAVGALYAPRLRTVLVLAVVVSQFLIAANLIATLDAPYQDVHLFQQEASEALLGAENPYELRYRNIYGEGTDLYAPEVQSGEFLTFGFPYPPLSLLMALPGYVLGAEYRYATIAAMSLTAVLLAFMRPGAVGAGVAALFLLSPLTLPVIYNGWTEPFVGLLFATAVTLALRAPRLTPVLLGLLIASKQYVAPVLLPAVVLLEGVRRQSGTIQMVVVPAAVATATVVPFLIWNPGDFTYSVLLLQAYQPFRIDSVSIPGLLARSGGWVAPAWLAFVGGGLVLLAVTRWAPRSPAGFAGAAAVFFFIFFLLSKQAFMNYYYFVLVALACAVAAASHVRVSLDAER